MAERCLNTQNRDAFNCKVQNATQRHSATELSRHFAVVSRRVILTCTCRGVYCCFKLSPSCPAGCGLRSVAPRHWRFAHPDPFRIAIIHARTIHGSPPATTKKNCVACLPSPEGRRSYSLRKRSHHSRSIAALWSAPASNKLVARCVHSVCPPVCLR